jgi:hypothetical protein
MKPFLFCLLTFAFASGVNLAAAQSSHGDPPDDSASRGRDPLLASLPRWDANHDGVYTCDEWKLYVNRLFNAADRSGRGYINAKQFEAIQHGDPMFADADFAYFDENKDGQLSRSEFVDAPSPFFLRFDKNGDCKVTSDELKSSPKPPEQPRRGRGSGASR